MSAGPFIGPKGGKWADPQHTVPWRPVVQAKPGEKMQMHGKDYHAEVDKVEDGKAHVVQVFHDGRGSAVKMPVESVQGFHDDLNGIVRGPAHAPHPAIQDVLDEKAEFLGKGDDGMAFRAGDKVVKVSTGVPFQPMNHGHLTPKAAANRLVHQANVSEHLRKLGVPGLLPMKTYRHGDKSFQVRDHVEIPRKLTKEQLDDAKETMLAMHKHGYSLNDDVQVGVKDGKGVLYDTGKASPMKNPSDNSIYSPKRADLERLDRLYAEHGHAPARGTKGPFDQMKDQAFADYDAWAKDKIAKGGATMQKAGGPFIGPKGGMWADAKHTAHWVASQAHLTPGTPEHGEAKARFQSELRAASAVQDLAKTKTGQHGSVLKQLSGRMFDQKPYDDLAEKHPKHIAAGLRHAAGVVRAGSISEHNADVAQHMETSASEIEAMSTPKKATPKKTETRAGERIPNALMSAFQTDVLDPVAIEEEDPEEAARNGLIRSAIQGSRLVVPDDAESSAKLKSALASMAGHFSELADSAPEASERKLYSDASDQCSDLASKIVAHVPAKKDSVREHAIRAAIRTQFAERTGATPQSIAEFIKRHDLVPSVTLGEISAQLPHVAEQREGPVRGWDDERGSDASYDRQLELSDLAAKYPRDAHDSWVKAKSDLVRKWHKEDMNPPSPNAVIGHAVRHNLSVPGAYTIHPVTATMRDDKNASWRHHGLHPTHAAAEAAAQETVAKFRKGGSLVGLALFAMMKAMQNAN